jgi:ubiquinone/menaquinone biosynthesis C-methylase UbiE
MPHRVCPWWLGYFLLGRVRRWFQDPAEILKDHVTPGMTVLEPGPGMGFFTLELARLVGPRGRVVAVDVQDRMLAVLRRRAERAGVSSRIETRLSTNAELGVDDLAGKVDFVLAFALVHEVPDAVAFFTQVARVLRSSGRVLLAEPRGHVSEAKFTMTLEEAAATGLRLAYLQAISHCRAAVLIQK